MTGSRTPLQSGPMSLTVSTLKPLLLIAAILMAACSNRASTFVAAPAPDSGNAIIYLYRPASSANFMMSPRLVIDGDEAFAIANGDYRYVYLQGGEHVFGLMGTDRYGTGVPVRLNVEAGESYFLRVNTELKFEAQTMNTRNFWLDSVDQTQALTEIVHTDYAGTTSQQSSRAPTADPAAAPGFSVDRTQDPFAGKYE